MRDWMSFRRDFGMSLILILMTSIIACSRESPVDPQPVESLPVESLEHFRASIDYVSKSNSMSNEWGPSGVVKKDKIDAVMKLKRLALEEAELVDPAALAILHPDMPDRFKVLLIEGLRKNIAGWDSEDLALMQRGGSLISDWGDWYIEWRDNEFGEGEPHNRDEAPRNEAEVRELFVKLVDNWNSSAPHKPADCGSDLPERLQCVEQFRVEAPSDRLALVNHVKFSNDLTESQFNAIELFYKGNSQQNEQVCAGPMMDIIRKFGATVEFHYYSKDERLVFTNVIGLRECEDFAELQESRMPEKSTKD